MRLFAIGVMLNFFLFAGAWAADPAVPATAASKKAPGAGEIPPQLLRYQLEQTYRVVRGALEARDYQTFLQLVIPARAGPPPSEEAFNKVALNLLDDYPVLEQLNFAKVGQSGDWAGYYTENRVADLKRTYILFFKFKRAKEGWKMSGRVTVVDIPRIEGQFRTLDEIALNPKFRLPGQRGYKE
jgi:hypothetical protein